MSIMLEMENDDVTEVIEDEDGYYVVRMINNNSPEAYDKKVEEAITEKEGSLCKKNTMIIFIQNIR